MAWSWNRKDYIRCFAITLQLVIYMANAFIWAASILAVICGYVIGIANDTIRVNTPKDLGITTPATILIVYGFFMIIVTTVGCFSSVTAGKIVSVLYILLIIGYIFFDAFGGYLFLFSDEGFFKYYTNVNDSLANYGNESSKGIGIFPVSPEEFWNHLQSRGKCCGIVSLEDWRKTTFSRTTFNIPDSCCNDDYNYRYCGLLVFHHPDTEYHSIDNMVHSKGCNEIFPEPMRYPPADSISYLGLFVGSLIIVCCVLTFVLFLLVVTKTFRKDQGIDNLDYVTSPKEEENGNVGGAVMNGSGEQGQTMYGQKRVYPEDQVENTSDPNANKRVLFREHGPQFIKDKDPDPSRPESEDDSIHLSDVNKSSTSSSSRIV